MKWTLFAVAGICGCLMMAGCDLINPAEKVPTNVHVDSFTFSNPNPVQTGTASHKITCVWVYFNNNPVGVFDLPATFPVIMDGPGTLQIVPGVTYSGLNDFQTLYPFYAAYQMQLDYKPGETVTAKPETRYNTDIKFNYKEDFEIGNSFIKLYDEDSALIRIEDNAYVFEGGASGYMYVRSSGPVKSENIVSSGAGFPISTGQSYLEIDYKSSVPFSIGLQSTNVSGTNDAEYIISVRPSNGVWKKMYVGLQSYTGSFKGVAYRVLLKAFLDGQTEGYVAVDNIKVISY